MPDKNQAITIVPHGLKFTGFFDELDTKQLTGLVSAFPDKAKLGFSAHGGCKLQYFCSLTTENETIKPAGYHDPAFRAFLIEMESRLWKTASVRVLNGIRLENGTDLMGSYQEEFFEIKIDREEDVCEISCRFRERALTDTFIAELRGTLRLSAKPTKYGRDVPVWLETKLLCDSMHRCNICRQENVIIHHIVEVEVGGKTEENNLIVLCVNCHRQAHSKSQLTKNLRPEHLREYKLRHANWVAAQGVPQPIGKVAPLDGSEGQS